MQGDKTSIVIYFIRITLDSIAQKCRFILFYKTVKKISKNFIYFIRTYEILSFFDFPKLSGQKCWIAKKIKNSPCTKISPTIISEFTVLSRVPFIDAVLRKNYVKAITTKLLVWTCGDPFVWYKTNLRFIRLRKKFFFFSKNLDDSLILFARLFWFIFFVSTYFQN